MAVVSKRVRYALHGLAYIAKFSEGDAVSFETILTYLRAYSQRLSLSPSYIAKIFQDVSRAGFTVAAPGPRGGYRLARPPEEISLVQVIEALDGPLLSECCLLSVGTCSQELTCGVRKVIHEAELTYYRFFERQTIASLARKATFPDLGLGRPRKRTKAVSPSRRRTR